MFDELRPGQRLSSEIQQHSAKRLRLVFSGRFRTVARRGRCVPQPRVGAFPRRGLERNAVSGSDRKFHNADQCRGLYSRRWASSLSRPSCISPRILRRMSSTRWHRTWESFDVMPSPDKCWNRRIRRHRSVQSPPGAAPGNESWPSSARVARRGPDRRADVHSRWSHQMLSRCDMWWSPHL